MIILCYCDLLFCLLVHFPTTRPVYVRRFESSIRLDFILAALVTCLEPVSMSAGSEHLRLRVDWHLHPPSVKHVSGHLSFLSSHWYTTWIRLVS